MTQTPVPNNTTHNFNPLFTEKLQREAEEWDKAHGILPHPLQEESSRPPAPSYDMVIPGEIRTNPNLSKNHQWLYALIRNLCRMEGCCWATDQYLAIQASESVPTIKRYIKHLENCGVIRRETMNFSMKRRRRIYLMPGYRNPPKVPRRNSSRSNWP